MRSVLFIAYLFPPLGGPGVQRTLSFVRHLPALGWRPEVVAVDDEGGYWARDPSLCARIPGATRVHRVKEGLPGRAAGLIRRTLPSRVRSGFDRALMVPDRQIPWAAPALRAAMEVVRRRRPRVIFATGAPWTNLLVGRWVTHRTGIPLVTDLRDPWTDSTVFRPFSELHRRCHRALEASTHEAAVRIVANSEGNLAQMQASFPVTVGKALCIPNGWDELDFVALEPVPLPAEGLRIGYAGNFYAGRGVLEVLRLFGEARALRPGLEPIELRFVGHTGAGAAAASLGLTGVSDLGYRPLGEALQLLTGCHATLVTVPTGARPGWVPQKLYQQLRLGRPVLTLAPPGEAADITAAAGQLVVDPGRADAGAALARALERLAEGKVGPPSPPVVARYDRRRLAARLASVFDAVDVGDPSLRA